MADVNCTRCGAPLQFRAPEHNPDARLLRKSAAPVGYCASCAMTHWLQHSFYAETILSGIVKRGPVILLDRRVVEQMANVLAAGCADAKPQEIDWLSVVIHWDLPFPCEPGCDAGPARRRPSSGSSARGSVTDDRLF